MAKGRLSPAEMAGAGAAGLEDDEENALVAHATDIRSVIELCCEANARALVLSFEDEAVCRARFLSVDGSVLRLSMEGDLPPRLRPPTHCAVSLRLRQRHRVFVATVLGVRPGEMSGGALELLLKAPSEMASGDPRLAIRVPVMASDPLRVDLRVDGAPVEEARALNLSLIGMLLETSQSDLALSQSSKLEVTLVRGSATVRLKAELRRRHEGRLALFFPEVLEGGALAPPPALRQIVQDLELAWRSRRAR